MRTTVRLNDALLRSAKEYALQHGKTLTALIEDSLRATLSFQKHPKKQRPIKLPVSGKGGVLPGVDLDNSATLLDIMENSK